MTTVLGLDAAWTDRHPSGLAVVEVDGRGARLTAVARSWGELLEPEAAAWTELPPLGAGRLSAGLDAIGRIDVAAVDMPLARGPVLGRRACDRAISRAYGSRRAPVHSPTASRPGPLAATVRDALAARGLSLRTAEPEPVPGQAPDGPVAVEVYPHAAIIELMQLPCRLPYKVARRSSYWPYAPPEQRFAWAALFLDALRDALAGEILDVADRIPSARAVLAATTRRKEAVLKGLEDVLDACVCAWVGCAVHTGEATVHGDADAAIWVRER